MTRHQKRLSVPKSWPVARKQQTYTVKAGAGPHGEAGVPLLVLLRDVLGYVDSKKEARYALSQGSVLINGVAATDVNRPVGMFDILAFAEREEYYRVFPGQGGRLSLTPIDEESADSKLGKVTGKRHVSGGRIQLSLHDGMTLLTDDESIAGGDSIVVDNETKAVVAHFPYEEGALVTAVQGRHAGEIGTIADIDVTPGSSSNNVTVEQDGDGGFETVGDYVVVIDENFTDDEAAATEAEAAAEATATESDEPETDEAAADEESDADDADEEVTEE